MRTVADKNLSQGDVLSNIKPQSNCRHEASIKEALKCDKTKRSHTSTVQYSAVQCTSAQHLSINKVARTRLQETIFWVTLLELETNLREVWSCIMYNQIIMEKASNTLLLWINVNAILAYCTKRRPWLYNFMLREGSFEALHSSPLVARHEARF